MRVHAEAEKQHKRLVRGAIAQRMATRFPTLSNFILQTKQTVGHKGFSHQMQRLESRLLIDGVCGQLMRERPDTPILTIHDSLLTAQETQSIVRETFDRTLANAGIAASITSTNYK